METTTSPLLPTPPCDKTLITRVSGPEPGYVATPIIFVELARCLLAQREALPPPLQGGVYTPGAVFYPQPEALIERLNKAGVRFEVVGE